MAYLLGNQDCMDSLQRDVQDLQWTINDVLSRTGPVTCPSWKFPDKKACDVDIDDLLDLYDCSEDDDVEDKQVAHIALYELLIDRLVFLIRSSSAIINNQLTPGNVKHISSLKEGGSVGVIMKQFWFQMISLQTHFKQLMSENKLFSAKLNEKQLHKSDDSPTDDDRFESKSYEPHTKVTNIETPGILGVIPPNTADMVLMGMSSSGAGDSQFSISRDTNNKSCQTYETAFVPCESCDVIQRKMRDAGEIVIKICSEQGLPCSLKKFKSEVAHVELLTFNDVCRWMAEQNKDIARVGKQNEVLQSSIKPMKAEVKNCQKRTSAAEEKAKMCEYSMKEEKETQSVLRRQMETKMKDQEKKHAELLSEEECQKEKLRKTKEKLESEIGEVKTQLEEQMKSLKGLESEHRRLQQDLEIKTKEAERSCSMSTEVANLRVQLSEVTTKLDESSKLLMREQGKNRNASKHTESLQSKQDKLLNRMEVLGKENEELGQQIVSLEEEKAKWDDVVAELKIETKELRQKARENEVVIKNLMSDKQELETSIKKAEDLIRDLERDVQEGKERERMIVEYPDLNGPVNPNLQGTGNIVVDMDHQVTANTIRIKLLEEQNYSLNDSITRIKEMSGNTGRRSEAAPSSSNVMTSAQPLWQPDSVTLTDYQSHNTRMTHAAVVMETGATPVAVKQNTWVFGHTGRDERQETQKVSPSSKSSANNSSPQQFVVGSSPTPKSHLGGKQGRPPSGRKLPVMAPANTTSIGAYTQMKRALGVLSTKEKDAPRKGKVLPSGSSSNQSINIPGTDEYRLEYDNQNSPSAFSCPRCDKTYLKSRDLSIHLSYCTG